MGNLDAKRDWGHAKDCVEAQWLMLQQKKPEDFVIATGVQNSVREFIEIAANEIGITIGWRGKGLNEVGYDKSSGDVIVRIDQRYMRPAEVETLLGDPTKAREKLGWEAKISFEELVKEMVSADLMEAQKDFLVSSKGYKSFSFKE